MLIIKLINKNFIEYINKARLSINIDESRSILPITID